MVTTLRTLRISNRVTITAINTTITVAMMAALGKRGSDSGMTTSEKVSTGDDITGVVIEKVVFGSWEEEKKQIITKRYLLVAHLTYLYLLGHDCFSRSVTIATTRTGSRSHAQPATATRTRTYDGAVVRTLCVVNKNYAMSSHARALSDLT